MIPVPRRVGAVANLGSERSADVAEIQGLYGAFSFPEKVLQKIWMRRAFDHHMARALDGRRVHVVHPGKWNLLGGPDFRSARLRFDDGPEVVGDVELHLRAQDWDAHGHARDVAYDGVILHVVLFWPEDGFVTRGARGPIATVPLLPLLFHDLEEYAADEAVESLTSRPTARFTNELALHSPEEVQVIIEEHARTRWRQKVHFASRRVVRLGWTEGCHHSAMEVLGYRFNRAPMLRVASRWPSGQWAEGRVAVEQALASESDAWSLQGVRPANQPRSRLSQYSRWVVGCPDWPARLQALASGLPGIAAGGASRELRQVHKFSNVRTLVAERICGCAINGSRLDTLLCDAFLPLLAAETGRMDLMGWWFHWYCGDQPPFVTEGLRLLSVCDGRDQPRCHGFAQGILGWVIEKEACC